MKNIFLLGMPSSGKSTLGRALARELAAEFIDMDKRIELREHSSIAALFNLKGEAYFRNVGREVLRGILPNQGCVVSTGGGVPCFFDNMAFIRNQGFSIFLDVPSAILSDRMLHAQRDERPLFLAEDPEKLRSDLEQKYLERLPFYQQAHVTIQGETEVSTLIEILRHFYIIP